jgi:hypothetical protein
VPGAERAALALVLPEMAVDFVRRRDDSVENWLMGRRRDGVIPNWN